MLIDIFYSTPASQEFINKRYEEHSELTKEKSDLVGTMSYIILYKNINLHNYIHVVNY